MKNQDQDDKQKSSKNIKKSFKCTQCDRKFSYKGNLTNHLEDHENAGFSGPTETLPQVDYSNNPPGAVGYSGSTETMPQAPTLTSGATQVI